ncbi:hypothetical protein [Candidatus Parabeggiatoa sp. HSG14]|uniref:hypothetical protein n=1 Tax=Candidatus Parabeggiatoa sp. HSG14 TaxID=3055593 RepID=UPI0025A814C6|nr:hypothetical protein [Thiotrichales bacterium HSG14]
MKNKRLITATTLALLTTVGIAQAGTLDSVKKNGFLHCGVNTGLSGFSAPDKEGNWKGFDVDVCRAVSAAHRCSGFLLFPNFIWERTA